MPSTAPPSSGSIVTAVLVDASALVALIDADDDAHVRCVQALKTIRAPLVTVWPALTEAMHLLGETSRGPEALCDMIGDGHLSLLALDGNDFPRMKDLMRKYRDLPMDFAEWLYNWAEIGTEVEIHY